MQALGDCIKIRVHWQDNTLYGTSLSGRLQQFIQTTLHPKSFDAVRAWILGENKTDAAFLTQLVQQERTQDQYQALMQDLSWLKPKLEDCFPSRITLQSLDEQHTLVLPLSEGDLSAIAQALQGAAADHPLLAHFLQQVEQGLTGFVRPQAIQAAQSIAVGHATLCWHFAKTRLWVDPFFLPKQPSYQTWQPLSALDLPAEQHYVLFTHSHPDHFDPTSLLLFPAHTRFFVPAGTGETALTVDLAYRLRQLGFTQIQTISWWESIELEGFTITATPFYGEQAVGFSAELPLLWNEGATWHIRCHDTKQTWWLLADSGSDPRGHVYELARSVRQKLGTVDYVCGNCRRWRLYPAQYLTSSVPQYLVVTPDSELSIPQTIMLEPSELATVAELCAAHYVLPYAMGGAPWFAELGLGYSHTQHQETEFDLDPREALKGSATLLRLTPRFKQLDAPAGSVLAGEDLTLPPYPIFSLEVPDTTWHITSLIGITPALTLELKSLATLHPHSFILLAPDFAELWLRADDEFSKILLQAWLEPFSGSYSISTYSASLSLFAKPLWWELAANTMQQAAQAVLKEHWQPFISYLQQSMFASIPSQLLSEVYQGLTGLNAVFQYEQCAEARLSLPPLTLHEAAKALPYSNTDIGLALLLSKVLHNSWLLHEALPLEIFTSEQVFSEWLVNQSFATAR